MEIKEYEKSGGKGVRVSRKARAKRRREGGGRVRKYMKKSRCQVGSKEIGRKSIGIKAEVRK